MVQKNCVNLFNSQIINNKLLIICGPTATGKTALAIECAKLLNSEVISADSMYIYKGLDVGTAKPTKSEMQGIKHHLIDVVEPTDTFTVSDYKNLAKPIIEKLQANGKIPVVCGGTGFYINSLLYNFSYGNGEGNLVVREKYKKLAEEFGNKYVYDILCEKDFESAKKLHYNDLKRVIRALEIFETGVKKSNICDDLTPNYNYNAYSFDFSREEMYDRINSRVDIMLNSGLIEEVRGLISQGITLENQCMQAIGYKEVYSYLKDEISYEQMVDLIKLNTRHYAKRQLTFFKKLINLQKIPYDDVKLVAKRIVENL